MTDFRASHDGSRSDAATASIDLALGRTMPGGHVNRLQRLRGRSFEIVGLFVGALGFCCIGLLEPRIAVAQAAAPTQTADRNAALQERSPDALAEIVVTAERREERLQSVPESVIALSGDEIASRGVYDLRDLAEAIPGINLSGYEPDRSSISIRGVSTSSPSPTVGFYVDDVAISTYFTEFSGQVEPPIFDVQRVEVLKGPQGTLYGGSAMGGAIKFVSNPVALDKAEFISTAGLAMTQGGDPTYQVSQIANIPLAPGVLAVRLGASYTDQGGFVNRIPDGEGLLIAAPEGTFTSFNSIYRADINAATTTALRAAVEYAPHETLSFVLDAYYQNRQAEDFGSFWPNLPSFEQSNAVAQPISERLFMPILTVKQELGALELTSITSYVDRLRTENTDYTFLIGSLVPAFAAFPSPNVVTSPITDLTEEIRLSTNNPEQRFRFVTGVFAQRERSEFDQLALTVGSGAGVGLPGLPADTVAFSDTVPVTKQYALYGEGTFAATDRLELTLGGRAFRIQEDYGRVNNGIFNGGYSVEERSASESGFTPKAALNYKLNPDQLVYVLADKGFRPGGTNETAPALVPACAADLAALGLTKAPSSYNSDSLWNYEIGSKNTLNDGKVILNAAVYYIDWTKIQQTVDLIHCGLPFTGNVGAAAIKGAELEFRMSPIHGLTIGTTATYSDAYITQSSSGTQSQVGDPIQYSPKWVANANIDYRLPMQAGVAFFSRADYQWHGSQTQSFVRTVTADADPLTGVPYGSFRTVENPAYLQQAYYSLNMSAGIELTGWTVRLYMDNVTNNQPLLNVAASGFQTTAYTLRPRTIGFGVRATF